MAVVPKVLNRWRGGLVLHLFLHAEWIFLARVFPSCSARNTCSRNLLNPGESIFSPKFIEGMDTKIETFAGGWQPFQIKFLQENRVQYKLGFVKLTFMIRLSVRNHLGEYLIRSDLEIDFRRNELMRFGLRKEDSRVWVLDVEKGEFLKTVRLTDVSLDGVDDLEVYNEGTSRRRKVFFCYPRNSSALPPTVSPKKHEGKQCPKCERPTASLESLSESVLIGCLATSLVVVFGSLSYVVYLKRHFGKKPERQLGGEQATSFDDLSGDSIRTLTQQLPPTRALPPTPLQPSLRPPKTAHIKSRRQSPMYQDVLKYENSFQSHLVAQEMNDDDGYLPAIEPQMQTFAQSHCGGEPDRQGGDENERADMGSEESLYEPMP